MTLSDLWRVDVTKLDEWVKLEATAPVVWVGGAEESEDDNDDDDDEDSDDDDSDDDEKPVYVEKFPSSFSWRLATVLVWLTQSCCGC